MASKTIAGTQVLQPRDGGVEVKVVRLTSAAKAGLSTEGAQIKLDPKTPPTR